MQLNDEKHLQHENGHKEIIMYGFDGLKNDNHRNIYDGSKYYQFESSRQIT